MDRNLNWGLADGFRSRSQQARVVTEDWASRNLLCPICHNGKLKAFPPSHKAVDFACENPICKELFQLKATRTKFGRTFPGAAAKPTIELLDSGTQPNLLLMQFDADSRTMKKLVLVRKEHYTHKVVQIRLPTSPTAKKPNWTGTRLLLDKISEDGKIVIVADK